MFCLLMVENVKQGLNDMFFNLRTSPLCVLFMQELKDSRWSDARVLTCKNLHVRLGQALQDKETARRERDQALRDRNTAHQERDRALEDRDTARQERDQALRDRNTACQERDQVLRDEDSIRRRFTARESEKKLASKVHAGVLCPNPAKSAMLSGIT